MNRYQRWLFKKVFGVDPESIAMLCRFLPDLVKAQIETKEHLYVLANTLKHIDDQTGGKGWIQMVQNAIMQLDSRLDSLKGVLHHHQQTIESISQQEVGFPVNQKSNLN